MCEPCNCHFKKGEKGYKTWAIGRRAESTMPGAPRDGKVERVSSGGKEQLSSGMGGGVLHRSRGGGGEE